jgi:rubrerythrin
MNQTEKNLAEAFAGESQANRKYLAFAKQAEKEGRSEALRAQPRISKKRSPERPMNSRICIRP